MGIGRFLIIEMSFAQLSFLRYIFKGGKDEHQLIKSVGGSSIETQIVELAKSLAQRVKGLQCKQSIVEYFDRLNVTNLGTSYLKVYQSQTVLPRALFCQKLGSLIRQAYSVLKEDALLLVGRYLSLSSNLEFDLILMEKYPDSIQFALAYAHNAHRSSDIFSCLAIVGKQLRYFEASGQLAKAKRLRPQEFILFALTQNAYFPIFYLVPEIFDRKAMYIRLAIVSIESFRQDLREKVLQDFKNLFPDSQELLAFQMIYSLSERPTPQEYHRRLAKIRPQMLFYNLCRYANLYYFCLPHESECFLLQQLRLGLVPRATNGWTSLFYLKTKRYELSLQYLANTHAYFDRLIERNLIAAFCHLKLNQVAKALEIIKEAEVMVKDSYQPLLLVLLFSILGWVDKAIMLGQSLVKKDENQKILAILLRVVLLINYDKKGQPIQEAVKEIAKHFEEYEVKVGKFRHRFTILLFMSQFCYKKRGRGLLIQGRYFVKKMWEVVHTLSAYNKQGAQRLIGRIRVDQIINIEEEFYGPD